MIHFYHPRRFDTRPEFRGRRSRWPFQGSGPEPLPARAQPERSSVGHMMSFTISRA